MAMTGGPGKAPITGKEKTAHDFLLVGGSDSLP